MIVDHAHDSNGATSSSSAPQLLPKLYSTIDEINNHLNQRNNNHHQSSAQQSTPTRNNSPLLHQNPTPTKFGLIIKSPITTTTTTTPTATLNNDNNNNESTAPHLFLHFDINETILIGDPAGGDSVTECLNKIIAKSAFVSTNIIDTADAADDNDNANGDANENESGVNASENGKESNWARGAAPEEPTAAKALKRSPSSGNISSESTHQLTPTNWWNGLPIITTSTTLASTTHENDNSNSTSKSDSSNHLQKNEPPNPPPPPLYTGWIYPPSTCPYYRTSYKKNAKQFTHSGMHGEVYRPLYKELCTKVGVVAVNVDDENEKDGAGNEKGGIEDGVQEQGKEEGDMFKMFIPAFFYTLQHYFPSTQEVEEPIIANNSESSSHAAESTTGNNLNRNHDKQHLPSPPKKVTLILRTFGTDLPKVAKVISAFAQGQHPHFPMYYNQDLILNEDGLFCGGWRYLDAASDSNGSENEEKQELIYELHPPPINTHNEPTASKPTQAIYSGDDEVLNYLQSKTIVGIQDNYPFWRDHNHEPWSGKPVWARVVNNDNTSSSDDNNGGGDGRSGHVSHFHHHILLDDNIHNDPNDGAGGIRIPAAAVTSDHTVYESLHGNDALQMHGKHLIRVPTIRPLLEDDWFIRQIELARLAVFMEENGVAKTDVGDVGDKASTTGTVGRDPLSLVMTNRNLEENDFHYMKLPLNLQNVDLSRNRLKNLPNQIFAFSKLLILDVSRNSLQAFPTAIKRLRNLVELNALSNHLRMNKMPLEDLASLTNLRVLDLRYNRKLKQAALTRLEEALLGHNPQLEIRCTITTEDESEENDGQSKKKKKLSACDRDATLLQSQLEPLSTPQLAKRLERSFNALLDRKSEQAYDREYIMETLLDCYAKHGPREIRYEKGIPVQAHRLSALYAELEAIPWPRTTRERPKIKAEYYMILQKPGSGKPDSTRTKKEAAKLNKYVRVFDLAVETLKEVDADFANRFTALAVTKNFVGSPHIDTLNVGPFYGLSLGEFTGGGNIAVECSPFLVAEVETRGRFGKVDGRFPHWVTPYKGTRYSLIYYVTSGNVEPQTTAIFAPPQLSEDAKSQDWVPPPAFVQ